MMKLQRFAAIACLGVLVSGCATIGYSLVDPGPRQIGIVEISVPGTWNALPQTMTPFARKGTEVWTRNGMLLDRVWIIPGVPDGEPLFKQRKESTALPVFRADMLPNELAELTESTIVKLLGEGQTVVSTTNLRPHRFGDDPGVLFDFEATGSEGPAYRGIVGAVIKNQELNLLMYLAATPHYFEQSREDAVTLIQSARLIAI